MSDNTAPMVTHTCTEKWSVLDGDDDGYSFTLTKEAGGLQFSWSDTDTPNNCIWRIQMPVWMWAAAYMALLTEERAADTDLWSIQPSPVDDAIPIIRFGIGEQRVYLFPKRRAAFLALLGACLGLDGARCRW